MSASMSYVGLIQNHNWIPGQARIVLPHSIKTEIIITGNLREWKHFFNLRTKSGAHSQMRQVAKMILSDCKQKIPIIFDDV
jgi:thymidylate synthase (FAD)